jgi:FkbM family methyltransferase
MEILILICLIILSVFFIIFLARRLRKRRKNKGIKNKCNIKSQSQFKQDEWITSKLNCKKGGYYIDIGSNSGEQNSNTAVLDKEFGFKGLCIDPFPTHMKNRSCHVINKALYKKDGEMLEFIGKGNALGGLSIGMNENSMHSKTTSKMGKTKVETANPLTLFKQYNVPKVIDYLSIDTEGTELDILKEIPLDIYCIKYIHVEHNFEEPRRSDIRKYLEKEGYKFEENIHVDDYYSKKCLD